MAFLSLTATFRLAGHQLLPNVSVIHVDSIFRAAHLLPIFDTNPLPRTLNYTLTLDSFRGFYVNNYIDYHAYETVL